MKKIISFLSFLILILCSHMSQGQVPIGVNHATVDGSYNVVLGNDIQLTMISGHPAGTIFYVYFQIPGATAGSNFTVAPSSASTTSVLPSGSGSGSIALTSSNGVTGTGTIGMGEFGFPFPPVDANDLFISFNLTGALAGGDVITLSGGTLNSGVFSALQGSYSGNYNAFAVNASFNANNSSAAVNVSSAPSSATLAATVFLEGAYNGAILNTTINSSIPTTQPYSINGHSGGTAGSIPAGAVDWVLVELREAGSAAAALDATKVGSTAGFLMNDGTIKATDGTSDLTVSLSGNSGADFYVVIYHRNHLPIMSANAISESSGTYSIDFTSSSANTYQTTTALASLSGGKFGLPAGDGDADGDIDATDLSTWRTRNGIVFNYSSNGASDFNLDGVINAVDRNGFHQKNTSKTRQVPST